MTVTFYICEDIILHDTHDEQTARKETKDGYVINFWTQ